MKKLKLSFLSLLLFAACMSPPRTTTSEERAWATVLLNKVVTAVTLLQATGGVEDEHAQLALSQVDELRDRVTLSATHPVIWPEVVDTVTTMALQWGIELATKD